MMSHDSWLAKYVPKVILVFQQCRLESQVASLREDLLKAQDASDMDGVKVALAEIIRVQQMLKVVNEKLGRERKN